MSARTVKMVAAALWIAMYFLPAVKFDGVGTGLLTEMAGERPAAFSPFDMLTKADGDEDVKWVGIVMAAFPAAGALVVAFNRSRALSVTLSLLAMLLFGFFHFAFTQDEAEGMTVGYGMYVAFMAALVVIAASFISPKKAKSQGYYY